jgi:pimeloyl-ACP methyl ester carboxylesterase
MRIALRIFVTMVVVVVVVFLGICGALFALQRSLLYYPQPRLNAGTGPIMTLPIGAGTVNVSTVPRSGPNAVLYFGGNAEDVSQDAPELADALPQTAVYLLHYPGYGGSSGSPTQQSIFAAALALYDRIHVDHPNITVIGRSLGSGVAVWIASQRPVVRLVLVTPFDSLGDAAAAQFPYLPVRWLLLDKYQSWRYAPQVTAPTRILVAADDEIVPRSSSDRLNTRFRPGIASYVLIPGVSHNTIQEAPNYWNLLTVP